MPVLYSISCGSSSAPNVYELLERAQQRGWEVCSILTPDARKYEVPEIVALPIVAGSQNYLDWIVNETGQEP